MENKCFRKKLLIEDIDRLKKERATNQEFIRLFLENNVELGKQIKSKTGQLKYLSEVTFYEELTSKTLEILNKYKKT